MVIQPGFTHNATRYTSRPTWPPWLIFAPGILTELHACVVTISYASEVFFYVFFRRGFHTTAHYRISIALHLFAYTIKMGSGFQVNPSDIYYQANHRSLPCDLHNKTYRTALRFDPAIPIRGDVFMACTFQHIIGNLFPGLWALTYYWRKNNKERSSLKHFKMWTLAMHSRD